jgi:hypothetical protein
MRLPHLLIALAWGMAVHAQGVPAEPAHPLVVTDAIGIQLSKAQVFQAAMASWAYTFGQEPDCRIMLVDSAVGIIRASARFNFRASTLASREETMGVVRYEVLVQAENGRCSVQVSHLTHTGNHNAPGGGVDLGTIYQGDRPSERIAGISLANAQRIHTDIRKQTQARISEVMKKFFAGLRRYGAASE